MCIDTSSTDGHITLGVKAVIVAIHRNHASSDIHRALALYALTIGTRSGHIHIPTSDGDGPIGLDTLWRTGIVAIIAIIAIDVLRA
mgnify:CR=1 FL=1